MAVSGRACPLAIEAHRRAGAIVIDDAASLTLPPMKQRLSLIFAERNILRAGEFHEGQLLMISFYDAASRC